MKRIFSILFCIILVIGLLPASIGAVTTIQNVDILVFHPVHMSSPDDYLQIYGSGCKLDTAVNSDGYQNGMRWRSVFSGKTLQASDTFEGNQQYELSVCLTANSGYAFSINETAITVNTEEASFTIIDDSHIRVNIQLTADNLYINNVTVTGLDAPVADQTPDYDVTVQETTCQLTSSGYDTCKNGVTWYDATKFAYMPIGAKFIAGHEYYAEIHLKALAGYEFPDNAGGSVDGTWIAAGGSGEIIVLLVTFAPCEDHRWSPKYHYIDETGHAWICADCKAHSEILPHKPGPEATATTPQTCIDCGCILTPATNHTHELTLVPEAAPTCVAPGCSAYYTCSGCALHFKDAQGKQPVASDEDLVLAPKGHSISDDWAFDQDIHWRVCSVCKEHLIETDMQHQLADGKCATCSYDSAKPIETAPAATTPQPPANQPSKKDSESFPWWGIVLIVLAVAAAVIFAAIVVILLVIFIRKIAKKKAK